MSLLCELFRTFFFAFHSHYSRCMLDDFRRELLHDAAFHVSIMWTVYGQIIESEADTYVYACP